MQIIEMFVIFSKERIITAVKKIILINIADSWHHFEVPITEYQKRLNDVKIITIKPTKHRETETIRKNDTQSVLKELDKIQDSYVVLCDIGGRNIGNTAETAVWIEKHLERYKSIVFVIGGAYGLDSSLLKGHIDTSMSISHWTFPHVLATLILLEQIYRCKQITKGSGYHHE